MAAEREAEGKAVEGQEVAVRVEARAAVMEVEARVAAQVAGTVVVVWAVVKAAEWAAEVRAAE